MKDLKEQQIKSAIKKARSYYSEELNDGLYRDVALAACDRVEQEIFKNLQGEKSNGRD